MNKTGRWARGYHYNLIIKLEYSRDSVLNLYNIMPWMPDLIFSYFLLLKKGIDLVQLCEYFVEFVILSAFLKNSGY